MELTIRDTLCCVTDQRKTKLTAESLSLMKQQNCDASREWGSQYPEKWRTTRIKGGRDL
jgi:hypothetical protein